MVYVVGAYSYDDDDVDVRDSGDDAYDGTHYDDADDISGDGCNGDGAYFGGSDSGAVLEYNRTFRFPVQIVSVCASA